MQEKNNLPIINQTYTKSNIMISSKLRASLLENKLMAIALSRLENSTINPDQTLEAKLYPGELKRLVSDEAHIYRDLLIASKSMNGRTMVIEDGKGNFHSFACITNCFYTDGVFIIRFNSALQNHVFGRERNFTPLELSVMTGFTRNSSFRIYELLKKDLYRARANINNGRVDVEYDLCEFRFIIGLSNIDNSHVKSYIDHVNVIDWEEAHRVLEKNGSRSDIKYKSTDKLQKDCLKPAQEELAEKSDVRFEYELIRIGRSYKRILFHIYRNKPHYSEAIQERQKYIEKINGDYQMEIPRDMSTATQSLYDKYVGHNNLCKEDLDLFMRLDENPVNITAAIEYADKQGDINNYIGYIVDTIKHRYYEVQPTNVYKGSHEEAVARDRLREASDSEETKKKVWDNIKKQKDFEFFLAYEEEEENLSFIELDELLPLSESCQKYINWRKADLPGKQNWRITEE